MASQRLHSTIMLGLVAVVVTLGMLSTTTAHTPFHPKTIDIVWTLPFKQRASLEAMKVEMGREYLDFEYNKTQHNLLWVTFKDFKACNSSHPLEKWDNGKTVITFSEPGKYYFISGFPGQCKSNLSLSVDVIKYTPMPPPVHPPVHAPVHAPVHTPAHAPAPKKGPCPNGLGECFVELSESTSNADFVQYMACPVSDGPCMACVGGNCVETMTP